MNLFTKTAEAYKTVDCEELEQIIKEGSSSNQLIDVRSEGEHNGGHIPKSKNINVMAHDFSKKLDQLDKNKTYYVYCASGNRSKSACNKMIEMGFKNVSNVRMGMMGWSGDIE